MQDCVCSARGGGGDDVLRHSGVLIDSARDADVVEEQVGADAQEHDEEGVEVDHLAELRVHVALAVPVDLGDRREKIRNVKK